MDISEYINFTFFAILNPSEKQNMKNPQKIKIVGIMHKFEVKPPK